jgi:hypothetical protein
MAVQQSKVTACQADMHPRQPVIANKGDAARHHRKYGIMPGLEINARMKTELPSDGMNPVTIA